MDNFLPVETVAYLNDVDKYSIKYLAKKPVYGNDKRFKIIDGKVFVLENYKYPLKDELIELYQKALIIAHNEHNLCSELSKISDINKHSLLKYFQRFTFKQIKQAEMIIELLKKYIKQNSLIPLGELNYE